MAKMAGIIRQLKKEQDRLANQLKGVTAALLAFGAAYGKRTGRRRISAAGRARIAAAQRARWAKVRGTGKQKKSSGPKKRPSTRTRPKKNRRPTKTAVKRPAATSTEWRIAVVDLRAEKIKKIAKDVYQTLGSGFAEGVYDKAMQFGLRLAKIGYEGQKVVELKYKNHCVGEGYPDLVIHFGDENLVVELKAISGELGASEEQQLRNYLKLLNVKRGLLINFQQPGKKQGKTRLDIREVMA
jgi:GxxExxY protein